MSVQSRRGDAVHRDLELFERMGQIAEKYGITVEQALPLILAHLRGVAFEQHWIRRGYEIPPLYVPEVPDDE